MELLKFEAIEVELYIYNNNSINNITIAIQSTFVSRTMPKGITNLLDFSVGIFSNWNGMESMDRNKLTYRERIL